MRIPDLIPAPLPAHLSQKCGVVVAAQNRHAQVVQVLTGLYDLFRMAGGIRFAQAQGRHRARVNGGKLEVRYALGGARRS